MKDEAFEALCECCSIDWQDGITSDQRGRVNAALKQLRAVYEDDLTLPAMIRVRADAWREVFPEAVLTPQALIAHWSSILEQAEQRREREAVRNSAQRKAANRHARRGCETCGDDHMIVLAVDPQGFDIIVHCPDCNRG